MDDPINHGLKVLYDSALGTAGITAPSWISMLDTTTAAIMMVGGALLMIIRVAIAVREWIRGRKR